MNMTAVMLAAGTGSRLAGGGGAPKALLRFAGKTLLARHVENLRAAGVARLVLVTGYRAAEIDAEIDAIGAGAFVVTLANPRFHEGSVVSLWRARDALSSGDDILFMDADVLYDAEILRRLIANPSRDCILFDREFEAGDEPVKLCLRGTKIVEFRKQVDVAFDAVGEWPGFLKLSPGSANRVAEIADTHVTSDKADEPCEEVFREVLLAAAPGVFAVEDITGIPWIEIDFADDVARAENEILPRLRASFD